MQPITHLAATMFVLGFGIGAGAMLTPGVIPLAATAVALIAAVYLAREAFTT